MAWRALSIIVAASQPSTLTEMEIKLNSDGTSNSIHELDLEEDEDFRSRLRSSCGLIVPIHHDEVHFLHQSAQEHLLAHAASLCSFKVTLKALYFQPERTQYSCGGLCGLENEINIYYPSYYYP